MSLIFRGPSAELCWYIHYIVLCVCFAKFYIWGPWTWVYENKLTILKIGYRAQCCAIDCIPYSTALITVEPADAPIHVRDFVAEGITALLLHPGVVSVFPSLPQPAATIYTLRLHMTFSHCHCSRTCFGCTGPFSRQNWNLKNHSDLINAYFLSFIIEFKQKEPVFYLNIDVIRLIDNRVFNP